MPEIRDKTFLWSFTPCWAKAGLDYHVWRPRGARNVTGKNCPVIVTETDSGGFRLEFRSRSIGGGVPNTPSFPYGPWYTRTALEVPDGAKFSAALEEREEKAPCYTGCMQNEYICKAHWNLGRALFGAYNAHSGGKSWDGKPVPSWSEIAHREHEEAGTHGDRRDEPRQDGVLAHWAYVAACVASDPAEAAWAARRIAEELAGNDVYQRVTS
jgi:hypothetical protein